MSLIITPTVNSMSDIVLPTIFPTTDMEVTDTTITINGHNEHGSFTNIFTFDTIEQCKQQLQQLR